MVKVNEETIMTARKYIEDIQNQKKNKENTLEKWQQQSEKENQYRLDNLIFRKEGNFDDEITLYFQDEETIAVYVALDGVVMECQLEIKDLVNLLKEKGTI